MGPDYQSEDKMKYDISHIILSDNNILNNLVFNFGKQLFEEIKLILFLFEIEERRNFYIQEIEVK
jgi:hypothetical protein